jgi:hypothetical protein
MYRNCILAVDLRVKIKGVRVLVLMSLCVCHEAIIHLFDIDTHICEIQPTYLPLSVYFSLHRR